MLAAYAVVFGIPAALFGAHGPPASPSPPPPPPPPPPGAGLSSPQIWAPSSAGIIPTIASESGGASRPGLAEGLRTTLGAALGAGASPLGTVAGPGASVGLAVVNVDPDNVEGSLGSALVAADNPKLSLEEGNIRRVARLLDHRAVTNHVGAL